MPPLVAVSSKLFSLTTADFSTDCTLRLMSSLSNQLPHSANFEKAGKFQSSQIKGGWVGVPPLSPLRCVEAGFSVGTKAGGGAGGPGRWVVGSLSKSLAGRHFGSSPKCPSLLRGSVASPVFPHLLVLAGWLARPWLGNSPLNRLDADPF